MKKFAFPFILTIAVTFLSACAPSNDGLTVNETRARPAFKGENGAVYLVIENHTDSHDALTGASTEIASATEIHMSMQNEQGVMTMSRQDSVQILPGEKVTFKPGGLHIMLVDLKQDLKIGDTFTLTLQFEKAGEIIAQVEVREQ
ncbi:MAG: copper chaperone PCu(A)C [Anaerolineales bacterium]